MKLYFLRHGTAEDEAASDEARELTALGLEEARIAGQALATFRAKLSLVLSSPLIRARQTAALAAQACPCAPAPTVIDELLNGYDTGDLFRAIRPTAGEGDVLLVGHMPSLAGHVARAVGTQPAPGFSLGKGALACVELDRLRCGEGSLRFLMRQRQLRELVASASSR